MIFGLNHIKLKIEIELIDDPTPKSIDFEKSGSFNLIVFKDGMTSNNLTEEIRTRVKFFVKRKSNFFDILSYFWKSQNQKNFYF